MDGGWSWNIVTMAVVRISDLLNRRSDLSTFVVHLTKEHDGQTAAQSLLSILTARKIEARTPMGWKGGLSARALAAMKVACFSETPLEHIYTLTQRIEGRRVQLAPYGIAFTKVTARRLGANPVWYVDMSPTRSHDWEIAEALDELRDEADASPGGFASHPASRVLPYIEQMGVWPSRPKEFWWERDWRRAGDFVFADRDVALVLCPEGEIVEFETLAGYRAVDPRWSLERMIAVILGIPDASATPFAVT